MPVALAALAVAGCLFFQPGVDQVVDALPTLQPRIAAPLYIAVSIGDLACIILTRNPKNAFELAGHALSAGIALHKLGVRLDGVAAVRNPYRGSDPWMDPAYAASRADCCQPRNNLDRHNRSERSHSRHDLPIVDRGRIRRSL